VTVIGSLCSGAGMLDMAALKVLGGSVAWHADNDPAAGKVLAHRWPGVPNHGDIAAIDWSEVEPVDVITAGYPCQPDSAAGLRRGVRDERWIWPAVRDAIRELGPQLVVLENVRGHLGRGFPGVVGDLAGIGYDARWCCIPASAVGAPHRRTRLFVVAWPAAYADSGTVWVKPVTEPRCGGPAGVGLDRLTAAHATGYGRTAWWTEPAGEFGRPDDALGGDASADSQGDGLVRDPGIAGSGAARRGGERVTAGGDRCPPDADTERGRCDGGQEIPEPAGRPGRGTAAAGPAGGSGRWGRWAPAIERWEYLTRPAPDPVELGRRGNRRLNAAFSEWMMGLPAGWVTAVPGLSRNDQLRLIGNGVVPQQGAAALRWLLADTLRGAA